MAFAVQIPISGYNAENNSLSVYYTAPSPRKCKNVAVFLRTGFKTRMVVVDGRTLRRYKRRWTVERTFAWLQNFRRPVICSAFAFWPAMR